MSENDLTDKIIENAQGFKRVETDSGKVEQFSLDELIRADKYRRSVETVNRARSNGGLGIRLTKISPDGGV